MPADHGNTGRFLCVIDPSSTDLSSVAAAFAAKGVTVVEKMDILNTLVLAGEPALIRKTSADIKGIKSLETEGTVHTQG